MLEPANKKIDIREYWRIFWRKKFFFIIPFILVIILGIIKSYTTEPIFQSSTILQIGQSNLLGGSMRKFVPGVTTQEGLNNLRTLITSHDYLKRLIDNLNLRNHPGMLASAENQQENYPGMTTEEICELLWINRLKGMLSITPIRRTNFIQLSAVSNKPEMAFKLVKTLTQIFIDESLRREVGGIRGALEFSSEQLAIYKEKLEDSEKKLQKFRENMLNDQFERHSISSANIDQVNSMLTTIDFELREYKDRLNFLNSQLNTNYNLHPNNSLKNYKRELREANLELSKLMLRYPWQDVKIVKLNTEIDNLQNKIRRKIEAAVKSEYGDGDNDQATDLIVEKEIISMEIEFLRQKKESLLNLINIYKANQSKGPARELTLNRLEREVETNRKTYQAFLDQTRGSEIEESLQKTSAEFKFKIIEPAFKPLKPINASKLTMILMASVIGIAIGVGLIFLLEYINHSFKNVEEVEKYLDLPVLGIAPKIQMEPYKK